MRSRRAEAEGAKDVYIREAHIDGFGALNGRTCSFDAPVTVVYGPNEAGKSTLLRFIRSLLYGFANRGQPAERAEPVYGGRHGGRLVLLEEGRELVLERYADIPVRRGGAVAILRDESGTELPVTQAELERRLLGGVSERLFRQLFAVTLDELQELRSIAGEEVGNYLYHAGMAGGAALTAASKTLEAEMDKLFKPKGALPGLNRVMADIRELETAIRRSRAGEGPYNEAVLEMEALEKERLEIERRLPERRREAAAVRGAIEARETWLRLREIRIEEAELEAKLPGSPSAPTEEEAALRWELLVRERGQAAERLREAKEEAAAVRRQREAIEWDERLLERLPVLEALEAKREAASARREELAELASDLKLQDELLTAQLARLSPDWGEDELKAFAALSEKEATRALQAGLAGRERELERLEAELRRLARQKASLQEESLGTEAERIRGAGREGTTPGAPASLPFGEFAPRERDELLQAWHRLEDELRQWERARLAAAFAEAEAADAAEPPDAGDSAYDAVGSSQSWSRSRSRNGPSGRARSPGGIASAGDRRQESRQARKAAALLAALAAVAALAPIAAGLKGAALAGFESLAAFLLAGAAYFWRRARNGGAGDGSTTVTLPDRDPGGEQKLARARQARADLAAAERNVAAALKRLLRRPDEAAAALLRGDEAEPGSRALSDEGGGPGPGDRTLPDAYREAAEAARQTLREAVHDELARLDGAERERSLRLERERRLAEGEREREHLERERRAAAEELDRLRRQWQAWLAERKLPPGLPPELLPELFQLAEQALQTQRQRARLAERAASLRAGLAAFEAEAAALFAACPPPAAAAGDAALAVKLLHREALRQRETAAEARRLEERLREAEAAEAAARAALEAASAAALAPPAAAGDADEAAYERRLRIDARRRELARERREAELRLAAGRDAAALAELEELLARHDEAALSLEHERAQKALLELEAARTELLDRRGRLAEQLERLRREAEAEDRLFELGQLNAEFETLADRYAVLSLASELIRRTKTTFEEERQPEVLRRASRYFAEMTGGAYARIVAKGEGEALLAETKDRRTIDGSFLSRGTREQMYLALRFALAGATSPSQALPLLLDDLFVHFDSGRLGRTARVLGEVAEERQVVLFTCHEHVADAIQAALPRAGIVRLLRRETSGEASGPAR
ncbi:hypothetical protein J19TS2_59060 [Cohnella xylanilytica]|uniref:AAA family ATPase n=1 Tax=Cohnella xylanilytica TaxID=557555 RepID=UPI001B11F62B|nr:AAA family ATPase [Cohnella xylanilytica]GIO16351.1 hypothetical protein J19TS2_59060 [Cohnella xylanilytica]